MAFSLKQINEIESIFQKLNKKDLNWKIVQSIPSLLEPNTLYFHQVSINPKRYELLHTDKDGDLASLNVYGKKEVDSFLNRIDKQKINKSSISNRIESNSQETVASSKALNDLRTRMISGIKGMATQNNAPTAYSAEAYPNGLFERYVVNSAITSPNNWGNIVVTEKEARENTVFLNVTNGVVSKESKSQLKYIDDYKTNQLFDKKNALEGYINPPNGAFISDPNGKTTDYIYCYGEEKLYVFTDDIKVYDAYCAFYNSNFEIIEFKPIVHQGDKNGFLNIPENCYYFRATVKTIASTETYNEDKVFVSFFSAKDSEKHALVYEEINEKPTQFIPKIATGMNLFTGNYVAGYIDVSGSGGYVLDVRGKGAVSDFIYCKGQKRVFTYVDRTTGYGLFYGFYDENKQPISGGMAIGSNEKNGQYLIPSNAVYFRQGIAAINEDKTDFSDVYIGFFPYPNKKTRSVLFYGTSEMKFSASKVDRKPVENDDIVDFETLKSFVGGSLFNGVYVSLGDSITEPMDGYASIVASKFNVEWKNLAIAGCHWVNYDNTKVDFSSYPVHNELENKWDNNVIQNQVYRLLQMITATNENVPEISSSTQFYSNYTFPVKGTAKLNANDVSLITIACGTNDAANGKPLGTFDAVNLVPYTDLDRKTMWSAMKWAINVLRKYLPNAKIVIIAPIQRDGIRTQLYEYVKTEINASEMFSCPSINMFSEAGIMTEIEAVEHRYLYDGLHPNQKGTFLMAEIISRRLQFL